MNPFVFISATILGVIIGTFSNYLYDLLKDRGIFRSNLTVKYSIILVATFFVIVLISVAVQTASSIIWTFAIIGIVILIASIITSTYGNRINIWVNRPPRLKWISFLIISAITSLTVLYFAFYLSLAYFEQRTVYIVLDASENMGDQLKEASNRVKLKALSAPEQVEVGMAAFGGNLSDRIGCGDFIELVSPLPKKDSFDKISRAVDILSGLKPRNLGSIQTAALDSLTQLAGRRGVQQIFIVASNIDKRCGPLDKSALVTSAQQKGIEYELYIATLGSVSEEDRDLLNKYTDGRYIPLGSVEELPAAIEQIINTPPSIYRLYYHLNER